MVELCHEDTQAFMIIVSGVSQNGYFHLKDLGVKVLNFGSQKSYTSPKFISKIYQNLEFCFIEWYSNVTVIVV